MTYASETWVLKEAIIQKLLIFERKALRRIFGPTKEIQIWRVKTNEELDKLIKHKNIVNYIKAQRLIVSELWLLSIPMFLRHKSLLVLLQFYKILISTAW